MGLANLFMKYLKGLDPLEMVQMFINIKKRDGRVVKFSPAKITSAIGRAGKATGEFGQAEASKLTVSVLELAHASHLGPLPEVEEIQDIVERVLFDSPFFKTAKAYTLYREQHAQIRNIATRANVDLVETTSRDLTGKSRKTAT